MQVHNLQPKQSKKRKKESLEVENEELILVGD